VTDGDVLTDLLGDTRARIVAELQRQPLAAADLAAHLSITPAAVRRHLGLLAGDGLVRSEPVHDGGTGRPHERWSLTPRGRRLFPDRSADLAGELLDHLEAAHGRAAVVDFLTARADRQAARYADAVAGADGPADRAARLARALSEDGFAARVEDGQDGRSLTLLQAHCAIEAVAREHPEICAHEAAAFRRLLGAQVSRSATIAAGADACICHVTLETPDSDRSS
jgi:predicted ArsR family transcriptional regulator